MKGIFISMHHYMSHLVLDSEVVETGLEPVTTLPNPHQQKCPHRPGAFHASLPSLSTHSILIFSHF